MSEKEFRVGNGFDVHPWSASSEDVLVLGGVTFEGARGVVGFSDGDVIIHACVDALLGAVGLGDIGSLFPDTDKKNKGADSLVFLQEAVAVLRRDGWEPVNMDCTVVLDTPKISSHRGSMEKKLSQVLGAPISIKGKRPEGVSGLAEGIHCYVVCLVRSL